MSTTDSTSRPARHEPEDPDTPGTPWWRTRWFAGTALAVAIIGLGAWIVYGLGRTPGMTAAEDMESGGSMASMNADAPRVPAVFGYYAGEEIFFIHTEVSDPEIAQTLEGMMGSPVPVVASLADVPDRARGTVYVFDNGIVPETGPAGPLGYQPDIFDSAPGDDAYTPLRTIVLVGWADESAARLLTTAEEVLQAEADGEVELTDSGVVVNAPLLTWPGGQR